MISGQEPIRFGAQQAAPPRQTVDRDARAENNRRTIHFEADRIVIVRRVHGVSMRVTMPVARYDGVAVLLPNPAEGHAGFRVILAHTDPDLSVTLYQGADPLMVDAALGEWSRYFNLPVIGAGGPPLSVDEQPVPPRQGEAPEAVYGDRPPLRRRGGALAKRRPRLYARRQTGDAARMAQLFRGEREIIARS